MVIESLPTFTKPARQRWASIPAGIRQRRLSNVWWGQWRHETTITNCNATIKGAACHGWANAPDAAVMWHG